MLIQKFINYFYTYRKVFFSFNCIIITAVLIIQTFIISKISSIENN